MYALGGKYTPKPNYFMLITKLQRYSLVPGQKKNMAAVQRFWSRMITLALYLNQPVLWASGNKGKCWHQNSIVVHVQLQLIMSFVVFGVYFSVLQAMDKEGDL